MYQYIVFDLDGTLTDPGEGICKCVQYALAEAGITESNLEALEPFIGPPLMESFMEFYAMTQEQAEHAVEVYRERFTETGIFENKIVPGIPELLAVLQEEGKYLAVASSKPTVFVERILEHFGIRHYFDVVVGSELDGSRTRKEEVVEETLKCLFHGNKKNYDKCVMVGDRRFDIEGAEEFHLNSIGVTYGYGEREELEAAGATAVVESVEALKNLLLQEDTYGAMREAPKRTQPLSGTAAGKSVQGRPARPRVSSFYKVCQILTPLAAYWFLCNVVVTAGAMAVTAYLHGKGTDPSQLPLEQIARISVYLNTLAVACTIPVSCWFLKKDGGSFWGAQDGTGFRSFGRSGKILTAVLTVIFGASLAVGLNIAIAHVDLSELSQNYEAVSSMQYSVSLLAGLFIYGIIMPAAEEFLFRGLLFRRIEKYFNTAIAIVMSAFIFGIYHGNLMQSLYGFLLGLALAWCYKKTDSLLVPILFHSAANISVFVITYFKNAQSSLNSMTACILLLLIAGLTWWQYQKILKEMPGKEV